MRNILLSIEVVCSLLKTLNKNTAKGMATFHDKNAPKMYKRNNKTRGSRGPWVAHLRKRSKVTVEPFTEDHLCCPPNIGRGPLDDVIHQI